MDKDKIILTLSLFNEKAAKLDRLSFTNKVFEQPTGVNIQMRLGEEVKSERHGPDDESMDAFVLTLRFFIQDNERISIKNVSEIYEELKGNPQIDTLIINHFNSYRTQLNTYLASDSEVWPLNGKRFTNNEIFDTFIYGSLAHSNKNKKEIFDSWKQLPLFFPLIENAFIVTSSVFLNAIFCIQDLNLRVIQQLNKT